MMRMRAGNPVLNDEMLRTDSNYADKMTMAGAINKTFMLLAITIAMAIFSWNQSMVEFSPMEQRFVMGPWMMIGGIGGFIMAMVTIFKKNWSMITAPLYAGLEGLLLGALSASFEVMYPGIVIQAVLGTFGTLFVMLALYRSGMVRATPKFQKVMMAAMGAIMIVYVIGFVGSFFGWQIPYIHDSGPIGIGFSVIVCAIAAFMLIFDFEFFERGVEAGMPAYMEWYAGFALLVTLIWLYLEILKLLAKLNSRRD